MVRTQIQLEEDQMKWLRTRAQEKGVSISRLIREGIGLYRETEERFPEVKKKKAIAAIGRYSSSRSDVSERHDDYLVKAFNHDGD